MIQMHMGQQGIVNPWRRKLERLNISLFVTFGPLKDTATDEDISIACLNAIAGPGNRFAAPKNLIFMGIMYNGTIHE